MLSGVKKINNNYFSSGFPIINSPMLIQVKTTHSLPFGGPSSYFGILIYFAYDLFNPI